MGPMVLFTHLKITLLQYFSVFSFSFQFQFSVFSCFQTDPKSISDLFSKFLYNLENEQWLLSFSYSVFQIHFSIDSISHSLSHLNIIFSFILYSYSNLCRWNVLDDFQLLRFISIQFPRLRLRLFIFFFFHAFVRLVATVYVLCMNSSRKVWLFLPFFSQSVHTVHCS